MNGWKEEGGHMCGSATGSIDVWMGEFWSRWVDV